VIALQTVGGAKVSCNFGSLTGEWTGAKTASVNLTFESCQNEAKKFCQTSPAAAAVIKTEQPVAGELGFIKGGEKPKVGLDLKPKSPAPVLLTFVCGGPPEVGLPETWTVEGSVIGLEKTINHPATEYKLIYKAVAGKQIPEMFESGAKDTLITNRIAGIEPPKTEQAGLTLRSETAIILAIGGEPLEVKAK
jgi:hypothetical protein